VRRDLQLPAADLRQEEELLQAAAADHHQVHKKKILYIISHIIIKAQFLTNCSNCYVVTKIQSWKQYSWFLIWIFTELWTACMHAWNGQYVMYDSPFAKLCNWKSWEFTYSRPVQNSWPHTSRAESLLHEKIGEYKVYDQHLFESDDSWKDARALREGSELRTYIRPHRPANIVMVGLEERPSILLTAAPELL